MADRKASLFSLEGRVALVTGGSRGIGRMIAAGFLEAGARVYISSRKADQCDAAAAELSALGECVSLPCNISTVAGCRELAAALAEREPGLDILVNNAGAIWGAGIDEAPEAGWDKVLDLNLKSPFFLVQALLPQLRAAATAEQPGKIINIASVDGVGLGQQETYSYHASKAGLIHLTRRMAARLVEDHIHMTAIAPGAFATEMNREARDHADEHVKLIPARRVGRDDDMKGVSTFLASRAGDYAVGITITIDGGVVYATPRGDG